MTKRKRYRRISPRTVERILNLYQSGYKLPVICNRLNVRLPQLLSFILHDKITANRYQEIARTQSELLIHEIQQLTDNVTEENYQALGLMIRSKEWCISKYQPEKFGDKVQQEVSVKAMTPILNITLNNPTLSHQNSKTGDLTIDCDAEPLTLPDPKKHA